MILYLGNDNIPELVLNKCKYNFEETLAKNKEFPSSYLIAWY